MYVRNGWGKEIEIERKVLCRVTHTYIRRNVAKYVVKQQETVKIKRSRAILMEIKVLSGMWKKAINKSLQQSEWN